jgi:uncharacterized protein YbaP (TraB family)
LKEQIKLFAALLSEVSQNSQLQGEIIILWLLQGTEMNNLQFIYTSKELEQYNQHQIIHQRNLRNK